MALILGWVKALWELLSKLPDMLSVVKLRRENAHLQGQLEQCRQERDEMASKLDRASKVEIRGNLIYLNSQLPGYDEGPYCKFCWQHGQKLLSLYEHSKAWLSNDGPRKTLLWRCAECGGRWPRT